VSKDSLKLGNLESLKIEKNTIAVENTRNISKQDMVFNNYCPDISVDPETYEVTADGNILTCEPAKELPLAQRYFLF
jgi:urease subunit alpha